MQLEGDGPHNRRLGDLSRILGDRSGILARDVGATVHGSDGGHDGKVSRSGWGSGREPVEHAEALLGGLHDGAEDAKSRVSVAGLAVLHVAGALNMCIARPRVSKRTRKGRKEAGSGGGGASSKGQSSETKRGQGFILYSKRDVR